MDLSTNHDYNALLEQCQQIPVTNPGCIQAHGALFAINKISLLVEVVSDNLSEWIPGASLDWIGKKTSELNLGVLSNFNDRLTHPLPHLFHTNDLEVQLSETNDHILCEICSFTSQELTEEFAQITFDLLRAGHEADLHQVAMKGLHTLTDFGHIMVYRFDEHWNGHVISEWIQSGKEGAYPRYLDLCFPETDIPSQARSLYQQQWVRNTADVESDLVKLQGIGDRLSLSFAGLRRVAPTHLQYLKNMGVVASFSASIIVKGELWGLLAAHNDESRPMGFQTLATAEQFAKLYSSLLTLRMEETGHRAFEKNHRLLDWPMEKASQGLDPLQDPPIGDLLKTFDATGVVIWDHTITHRIGETPDHQWCTNAISHLSGRLDGSIFHTNQLTTDFPEIANESTAGLLGIGCPWTAGRAILIFRKEEPQEVNWGGDPRLEAMIVEDGMLNPRNSFEVWKQVLTGLSRSWQFEEIKIAKELAHNLGLANVSIGTLENAQKSAKLNMLSMLMHDIGNALTGVSGEIASAAQVQTDVESVTNLRRLEAFVVTNQAALNEALGEGRGKALHQLISEIINSIENSSEQTRIALHAMEVGMTHSRELLDLQKIYAQSAQIYGRECHLADLIGDATSLLRSAIEARGGFRLDFPKDLTAVTADRSKMMQILINLIKNGFETWDQRDDDKPALDLLLKITAKEDQIELSIEDNGIGFSANTADKILNGSFSTKNRSSGIGLMNCQRLANATGINLSLESKGLYCGATATLVFPREVWA